MKVLIFQALISLCVALITLVGGYFIYGPKLRKEQKSEFQKEIGRKKAAALIEFKEIIRICDSIEIYDVENEIRNAVILKITGGDGAYYPGFMGSGESLDDFMEKVCNLRKTEMYLDNEAAAYLLYLYKYMFEFLNFKAVKAPNVSLETLGALFIFDFQNWSSHADKIVVRDINAAKVEIQSHKDENWEKVKQSVYDALYEGSILQILQKDYVLADEKERIIIKMFNDILIEE